MIESWPQATLIPAASSSLTRVIPRRLGYESNLPWRTMLSSGLATMVTPARLRIWNSLKA